MQSSVTTPPSRIAVAKPLDRRLLFGAEARELVNNNSSSGKVVSLILEKFYTCGLLIARVWKDTNPPAEYRTDKWALKLTLELYEAVITPKERQALSKDGLSNIELKAHAAHIERKCKLKMWEYEGLTPALEEASEKMINKSHRKAMTFLSLRKRVREFK